MPRDASRTQEAFETPRSPQVVDAGETGRSVHPEAKLWTPQAGRESSCRPLSQVIANLYWVSVVNCDEHLLGFKRSLFREMKLALLDSI